MCVGVKTSTKQSILIPVGNTAVLAKGYSVGLAAALKLELRGNIYTLYTNKLYTNTNIKNIRYVYIFFSLMFFSWPENKINILTIVMMYASSVKKKQHVRCYPESQQVLHVWTSVQLLFISFLYILCPSDCSYGLWLPDKMQKLTLAL